HGSTECHPDKSTDKSAHHVGWIMDTEVYPAQPDGENKQRHHRYQCHYPPHRHGVAKAQEDKKSVKRHRRHGVSTRITQRMYIDEVIGGRPGAVDDLFEYHVRQRGKYQYQYALQHKLPTAVSDEKVRAQ